MKKKSLQLFLISVSLSLFIIIFFHWSQYVDQTQSLSRYTSLIDYNSSMKCPEVKNVTCPQQQQITVTCNLYNTIIQNKSCSKSVIKMLEMTSVLNKRDTSREAVFFIESTGKGSVKPRFVCALESAAQAYVRADVYLLVTYNPSDELSIESNEALHTVLKHFHNIQVLYVDMDKLFTGSPLEDFYKSGKLKKSIFLAAHTSDVIRFLTVWLYGGKYFDLDFITVKNLTGINNFITTESRSPISNVANGMFAYEKHSPIGDYIFEKLTKNFNGNDWGHNGPGVISAAMGWYTNTTKVADMNVTNLKIFKKIENERMFPIEFFELTLYFEVNKTEEVMKRINSIQDLIGVHIGNNMMRNYNVNVGSSQAYSLIAQKYCPRSYWSAYTLFQ